MRKDYIGTLYTGVSETFQRGLYPIARTIKASNHDLSVIEVINLSERVDMNVEQNTIPKRREEKRREEKMAFVLLAAWITRLTTLLKVQIECMTPTELHLQ